GPDRLQVAVPELDDLGVGDGRLHGQVLDAHLPELAVAALLRTLVTEERARVGPLPRTGGPGAEVRTDDAGGPLRAEGQGPASLVREGVHLLGDDLRRPPDATLEQLGGLEDGGGHQRVAVSLGHLVPELEGAAPP